MHTENIEETVQAAHNNALWCDAVCRAHAVPGEFHTTHWVNHGVVPPYTSKLVMLDGAVHTAVQLQAIHALMHAEPDTAFSVKDAFQCLDLAPLGFEILFRAHWIRRAPGRAVPIDPDESLVWSVAQDAPALHDWEYAWRGSPANSAVTDLPRMFPPQMLAEPGIHFLAGKRAGVTIAAAALNRTGAVLGLSNVFSGVVDAGPLFPGCVRLAQALYPDLPIVGYQRTADLVAAERVGFERGHGLTVWQRVTTLYS